MSETQELKLACLHHAGGDLDKAKAHYEWVIGSAPEASEQRATDQPEQPFNYRHPSKHDGSMPRRCYLDQLTPEELMIRDVAATVEGLGAHPLLTATVIKLMQAGEALADWVDIGLRDKAIQALLDPVPSPSHESSSQETVTEAAEVSTIGAGEYIDVTGYEIWRGTHTRGPIYDVRSDEHLEMLCRDGSKLYGFRDNYDWTPSGNGEDIIAYRIVAPLADTPTDAERTSVVTDHDRVEPEIPEGFTRWEGGACPVADGTTVDLLFSDGNIEQYRNPEDHGWGREPELGEGQFILAYRVIEAPTETPSDQVRIGTETQAQDATEQSQENPAAQMFGKALAAESEAKEQGDVYQGVTHPDAEFWSKALTQPPTEREQAHSLISKLFGAPKPKLEDA